MGKRKGHDIKRTCEYCHERVNAARAFSDYRRGFKIYLCSDCAKRRGIRIRHAFIRKPQMPWRKRYRRFRPSDQDRSYQPQEQTPHNEPPSQS